MYDRPSLRSQCATPNLPTNIVPTNIARLKLSGKFPMRLGIPPLKIHTVLETGGRQEGDRREKGGRQEGDRRETGGSQTL